MAKPDIETDWSTVLACREFWIRHLHLSDESRFRSRDKTQRKHEPHLYWALSELLVGRSLQIPVTDGFSLLLQFETCRESLHLVADGKRKQHLLGWVDPSSYNKLFRFEEVEAIAATAACDRPMKVDTGNRI